MEGEKENNKSNTKNNYKCCGDKNKEGCRCNNKERCDCFENIDISSMNNITKSKEFVIELKNKLKTKNSKIFEIFEKIEYLITEEEKEVVSVSVASRLSKKIIELDEILKRTEKNNLRDREQYKISVLKDIVNCFDSLLLIEKNCTLEESSKKDFFPNMQKGIKLTISQFKNNILNKNDVEIIEPKKGDDFIPNFHESFFVEETDLLPENKIISSAINGYKIKDIILKPALVKVSKKTKIQSDSKDSESNSKIDNMKTKNNV